MASRIDKLEELSKGLEPASRRRVEMLLRYSDDIDELHGELESAHDRRNKAIALAIDVDHLDRRIIIGATGLTDTRVSQILAEVS